MVKNPLANARDIRDIGSIPGSEWSLGGRHSNPLQYSCLENPMDRGAWQTTVHRIANTCTQLKWLSPHARTPYLYPLICWWTFRLLPFLGYGKQCCNKHWGQYVFLSYGYMWYSHFRRQPGVSDGKLSACYEGDLGLIPGLGRSNEGGHGNPLQYSCLENPHGQRNLAGYSPWGHKESDMTERLRQGSLL